MATAYATACPESRTVASSSVVVSTQTTTTTAPMTRGTDTPSTPPGANAEAAGAELRGTPCAGPGLTPTTIYLVSTHGSTL